MHLIRINREPSRRQLAVFALGWLLSLGAIGWLFPLELGDLRLRDLCWTVAVIVPAVGLAVPGFLRWVYLACACTAFPIGLVVSYAALAAMYYAVLTPVGLVLRLRGYDPLMRRFEPEAESYWIPRKPPTEPARYLRQF